MSFISNAFADTTASTAPAAATAAHSTPQSQIMSFLPMIVIFVLFWLLLIRPQQKKAKLHNQMISELQKGDEVVTSGGILGKISKVEDQVISLEIADNVVIKVQKNTVSGKVAVAPAVAK
ncbi:MAG: yajC [Burkholderiales bacterium]|jgi:preprotein translocase subunit YajC|nr:yajC [Burkholderiales bacterium]